MLKEKDNMVRPYEKDVWITKDYKHIKICDMETSHIENTIKYLKRNKGFYDEYCAGIDWDSYCFYYDDNSHLVDSKIEELQYELDKRKEMNDNMKERLKFISYNGKYPNLCRGTLIMELDGKLIEFPKYCLSSGGKAIIDEKFSENVIEGDWIIDEFPKYFPIELEQLANELVNENIKHGCCGGCI